MKRINVNKSKAIVYRSAGVNKETGAGTKVPLSLLN